ncbi:MAG: hypothetical protein OEO19_18205 [Gammaproteobacteria bacterium]|nr:hypothetical protein [Gammaproteobacteria bacterium]MDH3448575.1 hypothetical protein [Gammaproteobacteria bacterium]
MSNKFTSFVVKTTTVTWYFMIVVVLAVGWALRDQNYLVAEDGIGYWFGIIGGSMMLLIMAYPLRKRIRSWSSAGSVKSWFRLHMILGIVGPVIIIFHSGFKLGSFNSSVAFFSMIIVAVSGILGRYWYQRIHHGLYGSKIRFEELYSNEDLSAQLLRDSGSIDASIADEFEQVAAELTHRHTGVNRSLRFYRKMRARIDRLRRQVSRSKLGKPEKKVMYLRLKHLRAICKLGINEIRFSYWHVLHIPLLVMLVLSSLIHVAVVHLY